VDPLILRVTLNDWIFLNRNTFSGIEKTISMKKTTGNKIKLGIFVTAAIVAFVAAIYFVGERQQLFDSTFHITGVFKEVSGLKVGNNVRFSGINVGIVEDIEQISDSSVRVDMQIDEGTRRFIKTNARAIIGSDGLMGSKLVTIFPGSASMKEIADNATIDTEQPVSMDDILLNLKTTTDNAAIITTGLAVIVTNMSEGKGTIGKLLMDSVLAENVSQALLNIKQGAGGFKQNMDAASHNILLRGYLKKKNKKEKEKDK
jgi:phospholipid/cholesterol/gamma-HCH transport system substrate-binding protein